MMDRNLSNIGNERSASPLSFDSHSVVAASTTAEHNDVQASSGLGDQMSAASIIGPNIPRRTTLPNEMGVYTSNSQQQQRKPRSGLPADTQQYPSTHVPSFEPPQRPSSPAASSTFSSTSRDSASSTTLPPYIPQRKAVIRNSQRVYPRDSLITDPAATTTATIPSSLSLPLSIINNDSPVTPHAYYTPNTNSMEDASQQFNNNRPSHQQQQQIDTSTSSSERAHRDTVMSTISNSSTSSSISASMKRLEDLLAMPNRPTSLSRTGSLSNVSAAAAPGPSHSRSGSMTEVQPDPSVHHRQQQYQQPQHSGGFSRSSSDMAYEGGSHSATGLVPPHMTLPSQQHLRHASYEDSPLRNKMNVELEDVLEKLKARKAVEVGVGSSSNATSSPRVSTVLKDNIDELMSELKAAVISDDNEDDDVNSKLPSNGISSRGGGRADDDDEEEAYVTTGESRPVLAIVPLDNDPAPLLQPSSSSSTSATSSTANSDITSLYYIPPPANRAPPPPPPAALNQQQLQFSTSSSSSPSTPSATSPPPPPPSKPITERGLNADIKRFDGKKKGQP